MGVTWGLTVTDSGVHHEVRTRSLRCLWQLHGDDAKQHDAQPEHELATGHGLAARKHGLAAAGHEAHDEQPHDEEEVHDEPDEPDVSPATVWIQPATGFWHEQQVAHVFV